MRPRTYPSQTASSAPEFLMQNDWCPPSMHVAAPILGGNSCLPLPQWRTGRSCGQTSCRESIMKSKGTSLRTSWRSKTTVRAHQPVTFGNWKLVGKPCDLPILFLKFYLFMSQVLIRGGDKSSSTFNSYLWESQKKKKINK